MFFITCSVCASIVSPANFMSGVRPTWPETYSVFPALIACEYGPSAAGDLSVATTSLPAARTVSARAGYVTGNTMIYGRLGYQSGDMAINFAPGTPELEGHVFGLGVEHMFAQNFSGRIEVTQSVWDVDGGGAPPGTELESTRVSIGVAYHF